MGRLASTHSSPDRAGISTSKSKANSNSNSKSKPKSRSKPKENRNQNQKQDPKITLNQKTHWKTKGKVRGIKLKWAGVTSTHFSPPALWLKWVGGGPPPILAQTTRGIKTQSMSPRTTQNQKTHGRCKKDLS